MDTTTGEKRRRGRPRKVSTTSEVKGIVIPKKKGSTNTRSEFAEKYLGVGKPTLYDWQEALAQLIPRFRDDLTGSKSSDPKKKPKVQGLKIQFPPLTGYQKWCLRLLRDIRMSMSESERSCTVFDTIEANISIFDFDKYEEEEMLTTSAIRDVLPESGSESE